MAMRIEFEYKGRHFSYSQEEAERFERNHRISFVDELKHFIDEGHDDPASIIGDNPCR
jgi:hypothetical protein